MITNSDHNTCVAKLSYDMKPQNWQKKLNFATTDIPLYDTAGADDKDWYRASKLLDQVNWEEELKDTTENEAANTILKEMERVVSITIHKKKENLDEENYDHEDSKDPDNNSFRSKNHIPRQVRTQMRRKCEASKGLKTTYWI